MRQVSNPVVTEERSHPKRKPFSPLFAYLFAKMFNPAIGDSTKMFRGNNIGFENPIYIPKRTKFKGWMREKRRCSFNKNK